VIIKNHPWVYEAIEYAGYAEHMTPPEYAQLSVFAKAVIRLVASERERLREIKDVQRRAKSASAARLSHA
jgi:Na+/H+ antiporter NhaD/arsenite permease-like protein